MQTNAHGSRRAGISRRSLLQSAGLAVAGLGATTVLGGCGTTAAAGLVGGAVDPGAVQFWNLFGGGDGARLQTMLGQDNIREIRLRR